MQIEISEINEIINQAVQADGSLIGALEEIQERYRYLPAEALILASERLDVPLSQAYAVATFYNAFSLTPKGKHCLHVCMGTACHVRGGERVYERAQSEAQVGPSGTSPDMQFTVEPVRCLGCCGLAPVMRVDKDTYAHLEQGKVRGVLNKYRPRPQKPEPSAAAKSASHD